MRIKHSLILSLGLVVALALSVSVTFAGDAVVTPEPTPEPTPTPITSPCDDGRINTNVCEPVAIYLNQDDDGGINIEVWDVRKGDDIGEFGFFVPADELEALPDDPEEPIQVAQMDDGFATLYYLPSGEYQVNAGPDYEGKFFEFRFDLFLDVQPEVSTFTFADLLRLYNFF